jgi:hypothetical protein
MSAVYLQNKYSRWYNNIIDRARSRTITGYRERHHIIPRSLGGNNSPHNLVDLTAREHFICHLLLTRMTTNEARKKMVLSVFYLTGRGKADRHNVIKQSRLYEKLRQELAQIVSQQKKGCQQHPRSELAKQRYSHSKTGRNNPNARGYFITPWGQYESSRLAAKHCPVEISGNYILRLCTTNNHVPINLLSVCRSKAYLTEQHIGQTPFEMGFGFHPYGVPT